MNLLTYYCSVRLPTSANVRAAGGRGHDVVVVDVDTLVPARDVAVDKVGVILVKSDSFFEIRESQWRRHDALKVKRNEL